MMSHLFMLSRTILTFVALVVFLLQGCSSREVFQQQEEITQQVLRENPDIQHHYLNVDDHVLHYVINGEIQKPTLIIIHGTPGDWRQYSRYLFNESLLAAYRVVVIDRPGWGESILGDDLTYADFSQQAMIIAQLLSQLKSESQQPIVLMGHSLGASLAPQIAIDFPKLVDGLLLFAGTLDPALAHPRWFNYIARLPFSSWVIGDRLYKANQEIFALEDNIMQMSQRWSALQAVTFVVQGTADELVYPENIDYAARTLPSEITTTITLDNEGHLFPMTRPKDVEKWAASMLSLIRRRD
ncbi:alpha/beta fold hydrolase [Eionea flava]